MAVGETVIEAVVNPNEVGAPKPALGEDCQSVIFPTCPDKVIVEEEPVQIVDGVAVAVPPFTIFTVTLTTLENVVAHKAPFEITALYNVFCGTLVTVNVVVLLVIGTQLTPPFNEYSQRTILPQVGAVEVNVALLVAVHISVFDPDVVPVDAVIVTVVAVGAGNTVTVLDEAVTTEHDPLPAELVNVPRKR